MTEYQISQIFSGAVGESLTPANIVIIILSAIALGFLVAGTYMLTHKKRGFSQSFTVSLVAMAPIVSLIIVMIGNNIARAFSLAGAFSLIRFRSSPGEPKDIVYLFITVAIGLGCGMGYIAYSAIFVILLCLLLIVLHYTSFGKSKTDSYDLTITVPETLNYVGAFDDVFEKYTMSHKTMRVKTVDFGALFQLTYNVKLKKGVDTKEFLDDLRVKNGNLKIQLSVPESNTRGFGY